MKFEYRNTTQTMIAVTDDDGHVIIAEPNDDLWAMAVEAGPEPFVVPPEPDPMQAERAIMTATRFQLRVALVADGMLDKFTSAAKASKDPMVQLAWAEAPQFRRTSPTVNALAEACGVEADHLDKLFVLAALIEA